MADTVNLFPMPVELTSRHAPIWTGQELRPESYVRQIDAGCRADLVRAVRTASTRLRSRDLVRHRSLTVRDVPLPHLDVPLTRVGEAVTAGHGFAVLRGLPVEDLDDYECIVLIRGIAAQLGLIATQSHDGELVRHVRATGQRLGDGRVRGHQTADRLWFHTDGADATVLLCRRPAERGGTSRVASAAAVHNRMLSAAPDLVAELYQPFHFHMAGGNVPDGPPTFVSPIFSLYRDHFSVRFVRHTLLETPAVTGVPLSPRARAAFDLLDETADQTACDMELEPGDLQIVHNHLVLHSRTSYVDPPDPQRARHLLRCWITLPDAADRRPGPIERGLRRGWLTDDLQRAAASTWQPPVPPRASHPGGEA